MSRDFEPKAEPIIVSMTGSQAARRSEGSIDFRFGAGSICLDFAGTLVGQGDQVVDLLPTVGRLEQWLQGPELPLPLGGLTDEDLGSAHTLRAAIGNVARSIIAGNGVAPDDVRCINSFARRPTPVFLLQPGAAGRVVLEETDLAAALSVIARDAVHLLAGPNSRRLRECDREGCATLFFDRSPSGRRRWCSMKGCGERVASASYRRRRTVGVPR